MEMRRSRNSYMVSPRRVTMAPMGMPSRTLKAAMDFLALVVTGFWPAMAARSATRGSMILTFCVASPRPMLMTIFSSLGIAMALVMLSSLPSACLISVSYFCFSRAAMIALRFLHGCRVGFEARVPMRGVNRCYRIELPMILLLAFALFLGDRVATCLRITDLRVALEPRTNASSVPLSVNQHHIRDMDRRLLLGDPTLDVTLRVRLDVLLNHADAFDEDTLLVCNDTENTVRLVALILAGDNNNHVVALDLDACHKSLSFPRRSCYRGVGLRLICCALPRTGGVKLYDLGCERDDLEKLLLPKFASDWAKDAGADRLVGVVDDDSGVLVEANIGAVAAAIFFARSDDHSLDDLALFHGAIGRGFFDGGCGDIAEACLFAETATKRKDHLQLARAGVVGHVKHCSHLY